MNIKSRLLSLVIASIAAAIFVAVYLSIPRSATAPGETVPTTSTVGTKLKMSPRLVSVPANRSETTSAKPVGHNFSPIRPVLLFLLAFTSGWWLRQWKRDTQFFMSTTEHSDPDEENDVMELEENDPPADFPTVIIPAAATEPDELDDDLTNTAQIEVLQEKNVTKAKIIKALEQVVVENREKWINWDETEARMSTQIDELTQELNNAMRQAFGTNEKTVKLDQSKPE